MRELYVIAQTVGSFQLGLLALLVWTMLGGAAELQSRYDASGNLVEQLSVSNTVVPSIKGARAYAAINTDGTLAISMPVISGSGFRYQWYRNGAALAGATNDSLLLTNVSSLADPLRNLVPWSSTRDHLGTATAQGEYAGGNEGALNAFDGSIATKWLDHATNSPGTRSSWVQYAYAASKRWVITEYAITAGSDAPARDPRDWRLLASNDGGATWTTLDTQRNRSFTSRFGRLSFKIDNIVGYNIYRLQVDSVADPAGADAVELSELELIGLPAQPIYANLGDFQLVASNSAGNATSGVVNVSFDTDHNGLPDVWEVAHFGSIGQLASADPDGDGISNYHEFLDGTNPSAGNSASYQLELVTVGRGSASPLPLKFRYSSEEVVQLTATPDPEYSFLGWFGSVTNGNNPVDVSMVGNQSITALFGLPLGPSLDAPNLTWTGTGNIGWFGQTTTSADGIASAESGPIGMNESSGLQTTVLGPATLKYSWKISSTTNSHPLIFSINGNEQARISGEQGWQEQVHYLGSGANVLVWNYQKNSAWHSGSDCAWLDKVTVTPGITPPRIRASPANVVVLLTDTATLTVGAEGSPPITYQWLSNGVEIRGATNATFQIADAEFADAGSYRVVARNAAGSVTSADATIIVQSSLISAWGTTFQGPVPPGLSNVLAIATGAYHTLALTDEGNVVSWGSGLDVVPPGLSNVRSIAAGDTHSLALKSDGRVVAWGWLNYYGERNVPAALSNVVAISAGADFSVALKSDGTIAGWGYNGFGQCTAPVGISNLVAVAAGGFHTVALKGDGTVVAWGANNYGQCTVPSGIGKVVAIAAGSEHTLALSSDGSVIAWGRNTDGECTVPAGLANVVAIKAGVRHSLALKGDGTCVAWGLGSSGQTPVPTNLSHVVAITSSSLHNVALSAIGRPFIVREALRTRLEDAGSELRLSLAIFGASPLRYQWRLNGAELPSMNTPTLVLSNLQSNGAGFYDVVISNAYGTITNAGTQVIVSPASPFMVRQPTDQRGVDGSNVEFSATGGGTEPLSYSWFFNGDRIIGATNALLTLGRIDPSHVGEYFVVITNALGSVTSSVASLTWGYVLEGPITNAANSHIYYLLTTNTWTRSEAEAVRLGGDLVTIDDAEEELWIKEQFAYSGGEWRDFWIGLHSSPLDSTFHWVDGSRVSYVNWLSGEPNHFGGREFFASIANVQFGGKWNDLPDEAYSEKLVPYGLVEVYPREVPVIVKQPDSQRATFGSEARFSVIARGPPPLTYRWLFNGTLINNAADETLTLTNISESNAGNYTVLVTNPYGSVTSTVARLTLFEPTQVTAWGLNNYDQTNVPPDLRSAKSVSAGRYHSVALCQDGEVVAWGYNGHGETNVPPAAKNVLAVSAGGYHNLLLLESGNIISWGYNGYGQTDIPAGLSNVVAIGSGLFHSLALKSDGRVEAWGFNGSGQCSVPSGLSNVVAISGSDDFSVALRNDGLITAWGNNDYGQCNLPAGLANVVAISSGGSHSLALRGNGTVVAWGYNGSGECNVPAELSNVVSVAAGHSHSVALKNDGTVVAWGHNALGECDVPEGPSAYVAVSAGYAHNLALSGGGKPHVAQDALAARRASAGEDVTISLSAFGALPIRYQWRFNGAPLPNMNSPWLVLSNLQSNGTGVYDVVISNSYGAVTNAGTQVTVSPAGPFIVQQPTRQRGVEGSTVEFSAIGRGTEPLSYGWFFNGNSISGATNAILRLSAINRSQAGDYFVVITNAFGSITSSVASLTWGYVLVGPVTNTANSHIYYLLTTNTWTRSQAEAVRLGGDLVTIDDAEEELWIKEQFAYSGGEWRDFWIGLTSTPLQPTYHWVSGSPGTYSNWLTGQPDRFGGQEHYAEVGNIRFRGEWNDLPDEPYPGWPVPYGVVEVDPRAGPRIEQQPDNQRATLGSEASFSVIARGPPPLNYRWLFNGTLINDADDATLTVTNVSESNAGTYAVVVTNPYGSVTSTGANLSVFEPTQVTAWGFNEHGQTNVPLSLRNAKTVSAGRDHCVALCQDGTVVAWGFSGNGETNVPPAATNVAAVTAGGYHNLALLNDGSVLAWGNNGYGQCSVPVGLSNVTITAGGLFHSLALTGNGRVEAWGYDAYGQSSVPPGLSNVTAIAGGGYFSVALKSDGTVVAWGINDYGQCTVPAALSNVVAVSAGGYHTMALKSDGSIAVWGQRDYGQCDVPPGLSNVVAIAAGGYHSMVLLRDGGIVSWGYNAYGQCSPLAMTNFVAVSAGYYHSLALSADGKPYVVRDAYKSQQVKAGDDIALNLAVVGAGPIRYEWRLDGNMLPGMNFPTLTLSNVQSMAAGVYDVVVSNSHGAVTNTGTYVAVMPSAPTWVVHPEDQRVLPGSTVFWPCRAKGSEPLAYEWFFNGNMIAESPNGILTLTNVGSANVGDYVVVVRNAYGNITSPSAKLRVLERGDLLAHWNANGDSADSVGSNHGTLVGAVSFTNGIDGQAFLLDGGYVEIPDSSAFSFLPGSAASFTAWIRPTKTDNPDGIYHILGKRVGCAGDGSGVNFEIGNDVSGPVTQLGEWVFWAEVFRDGRHDTYTNGVLANTGMGFGAANSAPLRIGRSGDCNEGFHGAIDDVRIYTGALAAEELVAIYRSECPAPTITRQPAAVAVELGDPVTLSVAATGLPPLSYQWQRDGMDLPEATNSVFTLAESTSSDAARYTVAVRNYGGTVTSAVAPVTVNLARRDGFIPAANSTVCAVAFQRDGKPIIGGAFTALGGHPCQRVGRLQDDGTLDSAWGANVIGTVQCLGVQRDGKVIIGGTVSAVNGVSRKLVARLKADGGLDKGFDPGASLSSTAQVSTILLLPDGRILLGGSFTVPLPDGSYLSGCVRLLPDGKIDGTFRPGIRGSVSRLSLLPDGQILTLGNFTAPGAIGIKVIAKLNENGEADLNYLVAAVGSISAALPQLDGRVVVAGRFTSLGGLSITNLARLNPDATVDLTFRPIAASSVGSLVVQANGQVVIAGDFTRIDKVVRSHVARLHPDGKLDLRFNPGSPQFARTSLALEENGSVNLAGVRMGNPDAGADDLKFDGRRITWLRGGSSPEAYATVFEVSTNQTEWKELGLGTRVPGGWELSGLDYPAGSNVRGTAFIATSGSYGVSSWVVQTELLPTIRSQPLPVVERYPGVPLNLAVVARGGGPLGYQWTRDGNAVGNNSTWMAPQFQLEHAGVYVCVITNAYGACTSSPCQVIMVPQPTNTYSLSVLGDGPSAYWRLEEGNGAPITRAAKGLVAHDYVGGHNGIYTTNVQVGTPGFLPSSAVASFAALSSSGSFVSDITGLDFSTNGGMAEFSVEAWVKPSRSSTSDNGIVTLGFGGGGEQFSLDWSAPYHARFLVRDADALYSWAGSLAEPDDLWHHLVGVCDQKNSNVVFYLDGGVVGRDSIGKAAGLLPASRLLTIGARWDWGPVTAPTLQYRGLIGEVALYPKALQDAQVRSHFQAGARPFLTRNPVDVVATIGGAASLSVAASGLAKPLSFTWVHNGAPIENQARITIVNSDSESRLNITGVETSDLGSYHAVCVNSAGEATSADATLRVVSAPRISLAGLTLAAGSSGLSFDVFSGGGENLAVDASEDLVTWHSIYTNVVVDGVLRFQDLELPAVGKKFYRVRVLP